MNTLIQPLDEMVLLLIAWTVVALVQCGWGFLILRIWRSKSHPSGFTPFWVGFGAILLFLQLWHLVLPITAITALVVSVVGLGMLVVEFPKWRTIEIGGGGIGLFLGVAGLFALLVANYALRAAIFYDNGLYHLPSIHWMREYPIIFGLVNIYGPLAFNNSYFLVVALWSGIFGEFLGAPVVNGLLTLALVFQGVRGLTRVTHNRPLVPSLLLSILLLYPVINTVFDRLANYLSGPTTDYVVWLVALKLGLEAVALLEEPASDSTHFLVVVLLSLVLITIKLSGAIFAGGMLLFVFILIWRRRTVLSKPIITIIILTGTITLGPWLVRSIIMTGYPVYPSPIGGLPVSWRVSDEQALEDTNDARSWARYPVIGSRWQEVLGNWDWFPSWQINFWRTRGIRLSIVIGSVSWGAVLAVALMRRQIPHTVRVLLGWILPALLSLLFWFFSAPDPRYAPPYFWLIAMGGVVALIESIPFLKNRLQQVLHFKATPLVASGGLIALIVLSHGFYWQTERAPLPLVEVSQFTTFSGVELNVPTTSELCWDAPLPCTPYPNANLRLREAGNVGSGFTVRP